MSFLGDIFGSDLFSMSGIRNPEKAAMALGVGAGLGGGLGGGAGGGMPVPPLGGGAPGQSPMPVPAPGGAGGGAPQAMGAPMQKPGLMGRLGNPSWWDAAMQGGMGDAISQMGQGMSEEQQQPPAPPPAPPGPMNNPAAVQMAMELMRRMQAQGGPPGVMGAQPPGVPPQIAAMRGGRGR